MKDWDIKEYVEKILTNLDYPVFKEQVGQHLGIMYYNADAYSIHCKKHTEYLEWLKNRNADRYVDTENHGQQIDGKILCTV